MKEMLLLKWLLAAMLSLSPKRDHKVLADAIVKVVMEQGPLLKDDESGQRTAAILTSINWREGSLIPTALGDYEDKKNKERPTSYCSMQINLPGGAKTPQGWTGKDLTADPVKCVTAGYFMVRASFKACPTYPLAHYAEGGTSSCDSGRAQRISRDRMWVAQNLIKKVPWPSDESQPALQHVPTSVYSPRMFWEGGD